MGVHGALRFANARNGRPGNGGPAFTTVFASATDFDLDRHLVFCSHCYGAVVSGTLTFSEALTKGHWQFEELQRQQQDLRESEERFRNMADSAPVMLAVVGPDKLVIFFNKSWLEFRGRSEEEELRDGWMAGMHPDDREDVLAKYASCFASHRKCDLEYRLRRFDGEYRSMLCKAAPRNLPDGSFAGVIATCIDVTDVKRWQRQALAADKMESLRVLAMGVAHDFNNLLGSILASAENAQRAPDDPSLQEDIESIKAASIRGAEIVAQLMIFSGEESPAFEPVDVSALVAEMLQLLKVSVTKSAVLKPDLPKHLPPMHANPAQLRQLVMNLIINASEAMTEPPGVIHISTRLIRASRPQSGMGTEELMQGDCIQLEVSDTGTGISRELQAKIFEPFFTTKPSGHGLGLSVVQGIVRSHGGAIHLESIPGRGTTFEILLPIAKKGRDEGGTPIALPPLEQVRFETATVLVVEDDPLLRMAVCKGLRKRGFSVFEANDGRMAIDVIREQRDKIDVILLDVTLPGASSPEVSDQVRQIAPEAKIILTSAYSKEHVFSTFTGSGEKQFIRKPFRLDDLVQLVDKILYI